MQLKISVSRDSNLLIPILHDADEDDVRIANAIADVRNTPYAVFVDHECIGAALVQWHPDKSELIYIAIRSTERGQGYGKAFIAGIIDLGRHQPTQAVIVGTASTSIENIIFYQKCGFRMDSVRRDYFSYFETPVYEHGVLMQDMVMFRYDIAP